MSHASMTSNFTFNGQFKLQLHNQTFYTSARRLNSLLRRELFPWNGFLGAALVPGDALHANLTKKKNEVLIRLIEDHGLVAVIDTSSHVAKFLQSEFSARYLRRGASEPALRGLLPPGTYLVMVLPDTTAVSIATRVARHCKAGGDAGQPSSAKSFTVKVG